MKKSVIAFVLFFTFMFSWPVIGLAEENTNILNNNTTTEQVQNNVIEKPQEPIIDDSATIEENNQKIDLYNEQVDLYNSYVAEENSKREEEYNKACADVDSHNESEQQKVEQNKADLEKQEKRDKRIASDTESKTAEYTTDVNNLPNAWEETNASPQTILVEQKESDESYKVMNLHIYVDENSGDTYYSTHIENNNFYIDDNMKQNIILAEWECIQAGKNDIVTVYSQSKLYPNSGASFRRCLEGYTNGYWIPTQEFTSTSKNIVDDWDENGPSTVVSYDEGTTDRQPIKNILNVFVYNFLRYGAEPARVIEYTPDIWNYPEPVVYLETLNKLDRLTEQPSSPESGETPKTEEPSKEEPKPEPPKEEPKPSKEEPEPGPSKKEPSKEEPEPEKIVTPEPEVKSEQTPTPEQNTEPKKDVPNPTSKEEPVTPEQKPNTSKEKTEPPVKNFPENKVENTIVTKDKEDKESIIPNIKTVKDEKIEEPSIDKISETQTIIREVPTISIIENTRGYGYPIYRTITNNNTEKEIERIENTETATPADLTSKETQLNDNETPLANGEKKKEEHWALINLIAMIITILSAIKIPKKDEQKEDDKNAE